MKTEIIAFFSAENVFLKRTAETRRKAFDALAEDFAAEFDRQPTEDDWKIVCDYLVEKTEMKRKREKAKADREAAKAAKLEAMPIAGGQDSATDHIERRPKARYVLTSAQNNTVIDATFLAALKIYCEFMGAELLIGKTLYNKKAFRQPGLDETDDLWFDAAVKPYLVEGHIDLGGFHFIADANVIPTSKWPTSGFDGVTPSGVGAIIPATKIELRVGAALKGAETKVIASTGSVTKRNYILRKTGAIAAFGHSIGAVFVDTVTNTIRHLEQMPGTNGFFDLDYRFTSIGHEKVNGHVVAYQPGDIHAEKMEQKNLDRLCANIERFSPERLVLHDVLDFSSRNHHNIKDPMFLHAQHVAGNTVAGDLKKLTAVLDTLADTDCNVVDIVESNHDLAVDTWLKNTDWRNDPINAEIYLELASANVKAQAKGKKLNTLEYAYTSVFDGRHSQFINFHSTDESLMVAGIEMGNHGHNGANGSRGSPKQFASLGVPMNTGHTHSPSIYGPVYTAGVTASLEMGYNIGASSWAIADVITYETGQRQIIFA